MTTLARASMNRERAIPAELLNLTGERPRWHQEALCREVDPEVFYPEMGVNAHWAKKICARCPVREPCLEDALDHHDGHGVWGGLSEDERAALKQRAA